MHCLPLTLVLALAVGTVGTVSGQDVRDELPWNDPADLQHDLDARSPRELLEFAVQVQRVITRRALTPDQALVEGQRPLLELPNTGVARLLDRTTTAGRLGKAILGRGAGAYYSFATRDHSYDAEPDLTLESGRFSGGFYGASFGLLLELGPRSLATLPTSAGFPPEWLTANQKAAWPSLWQSVAAQDARKIQSNSPLRRSLSPSQPGSTFLLRSYSPGEHDILTAFRVLEQDAQSCTIAWRRLETWAMPGKSWGPLPSTGEFKEIPRASAALAAWLEELTLEGLLTLLEDIRATAEPKLMGVPEGFAARYEEIVGETGWEARKRGVARILHRGAWDALLEIRGGGCYFSFFEGSNEYGISSELELQQGSFSSGFAGSDRGLLLDIGELDDEQLRTVVAGGVPEDLLQPERRLWDRLLTVRAVAENGSRVLTTEDRRWIRNERLDRSIPAVLGHTYLLRSVLFPSHDHLVVFTVIDADEAGQTLAWKILKTWPVR